MQINITRAMTSAGIVAILLGASLAGDARSAELTPAEARVIAREAYIYGFPMVDSYRVHYFYFVNLQDNPEFKASWNHNCATLRASSHLTTRRSKHRIRTPLTP